MEYRKLRRRSKQPYPWPWKTGLITLTWRQRIRPLLLHLEEQWKGAEIKCISRSISERSILPGHMDGH